jgi:hypothetical protein
MKGKMMENCEIQKLRTGQQVFILWGVLNPYDLKTAQYDFKRCLEQEIVEVIVCGRVAEQANIINKATGECSYEYRVAFVNKDDYVRLRTDPLMTDYLKDYAEWDTPFRWEGPIDESKTHLVSRVLHEIKVLIDGWGSVYDKVAAINCR